MSTRLARKARFPEPRAPPGSAAPGRRGRERGFGVRSHAPSPGRSRLALAVPRGRRPTSAGVRKTPRRLEAEADPNAAGTSPRATAVQRPWRTVPWRGWRRERGGCARAPARRSGKREAGARGPGGGRRRKVMASTEEAWRLPVHQARERRLSREPRPVEEEEEADGRLRQTVERRRCASLRREQRGQEQGEEEGEREAVGDEAAEHARREASAGTPRACKAAGAPSPQWSGDAHARPRLTLRGSPSHRPPKKRSGGRIRGDRGDRLQELDSGRRGRPGEAIDVLGAVVGAEGEADAALSPPERWRANGQGEKAASSRAGGEGDGALCPSRGWRGRSRVVERETSRPALAKWRRRRSAFSWRRARSASRVGKEIPRPRRSRRGGGREGRGVDHPRERFTRYARSVAEQAA